MQWRSIRLLVLSSTVLFGCSTGTAEASRDASTTNAPLRVQTVAARARAVPETRTYFATLVAEQQAAVAPIVSGRVEERFVERGARVRAGDPLVRLRDADYRDQSTQANALLQQALARTGGEAPEVRAARAALSAAEDALRRTEVLASQGSASEQERTRARADVESARAQLQSAEQGARAARAATMQARAQVSVSRRAATDALVRAPFDGEVQERRVDVGDFAVAGTPVVVLVRRDALRARFSVGQTDSFLMREGLRAQVRVEGLEELAVPAVLRFVGAASSESGRAVTIEAPLERVDPRMRPGQFATIRVELGQTIERVVIPRRALRSFAGVHRAFVVRERRLEERVLYLPEDPEGDEALVARGLRADELVVLDPPSTAADGREVVQ